MTTENIIDLLGAIGAIATPIILIWLSALGWTFKRRFEVSYEREKYLRELEEKLRESRIANYNDILEPFILALTKAQVLAEIKEYKGLTASQIVSKKILSLEYRQTSFKLALIGSDEVLKAFNELMQFFYNREQNNNTDENALFIKHFLSLLGNFLLEIRKSMGNTTTKIDNLQMLEWMIKDIRNYRDQI